MKFFQVLFTALFIFYRLEAANERTFSFQEPPLIGIIIPLVDEADFLQTQIVNPRDVSIEGIHYKTGKIQGRNIVFALCGIGMINAAMVTTRLIRDFHPDLILMSGSAGGVNPKLQIGDVIIGQEVINVDFGNYSDKGPIMISHHLRSPQNNEIQPLIYTLKNEEELSFLKTNPSHLPKIFFGKIATSNNRPDPEHLDKVMIKRNVYAIDMEGAALMQVCWFFKTPSIVIRGISDKVPNLKNVGVDNMKLAGNNAAKVLIDIIAHQPGTIILDSAVRDVKSTQSFEL